MKRLCHILLLLLVTASTLAGSPAPSPIIWNSTCASGAFNLANSLCVPATSGGMSIGGAVSGGTNYANLYIDGSGNLANGFQLFDSAGVLSQNIGIRQDLASDGTTVMMNWELNDRVNIGPGASPGSANDIAIGTSTVTAASAGSATAIGPAVNSGGVEDVVIGAGTTTSANGYATVVGSGSIAAGVGDVVYGQGSSTQSTTGRSIAVGNGANTQSPYDLALGYIAQTGAGTGGSAISIGSGTVTRDTADISIGTAASTAASTGGSSIAIGNGANTTGQTAVAIGYQATAAGNGFALGGYTFATGSNSTAVGVGSSALSTYDVAIGQAVTTAGTIGGSISIGFSTTTGDTDDTAIGTNASTATGTGGQATSLGYSAISSNYSATALGAFSTASGYGSLALGPGSTASGSQAISTGVSSTATGANSIANGTSATAQDANDIVLGNGSSTAAGTGGSALVVGVNAYTTGPNSTVIGIGANDTVAVGGVTLGGYNSNTSSYENWMTILNGVTTFPGQAGFGTRSPSAEFQFVTADDTTPYYVVAWDSRHTFFGQPGAQGAGVGFSNSSGSNTENIIFLAPNIAWQNAQFEANTFSFLSGGVTQGLYQDGSGYNSFGVGINDTSSVLAADTNLRSLNSSDGLVLANWYSPNEFLLGSAAIADGNSILQLVKGTDITPVADSNSIAQIRSNSNATNWWFNVAEGATNATFGFAENGTITLALTYDNTNKLLGLSANGAGSSPDTLWIDQNKNAYLFGGITLGNYAGVTSPQTGMIAYDTMSQAVALYNGATWNDIGGGGGLWSYNMTYNAVQPSGSNYIQTASGYDGILSSSGFMVLDTNGTLYFPSMNSAQINNYGSTSVIYFEDANNYQQAWVDTSNGNSYFSSTQFGLFGSIASPQDGMVAYDGTNHLPIYYNGSAWIDLAVGPGFLPGGSDGDVLAYTSGNWIATTYFADNYNVNALQPVNRYLIATDGTTNALSWGSATAPGVIGLTPIATPGTVGPMGEIYFDMTAQAPYFSDGTTWQPMGGGAPGLWTYDPTYNALTPMGAHNLELPSGYGNIYNGYGNAMINIDSGILNGPGGTTFTWGVSPMAFSDQVEIGSAPYGGYLFNPAGNPDVKLAFTSNEPTPGTDVNIILTLYNQVMKIYDNATGVPTIALPTLVDSSGGLSIDPTDRLIEGPTSGVMIDYSEGVGAGMLAFPNAAYTTGSGVGTFTNVPGSAGNPTGYLQVYIRGTLSYIPYWQ